MCAFGYHGKNVAKMLFCEIRKLKEISLQIRGFILFCLSKYRKCNARWIHSSAAAALISLLTMPAEDIAVFVQVHCKYTHDQNNEENCGNDTVNELTFNITTGPLAIRLLGGGTFKNFNVFGICWRPLSPW